MQGKVQELAPLLADNFIDFDAQASDWAFHEKIVEESQSILEEYAGYLGKLHDSWFTGINLTSGGLSIVLNDI